MATLHETPKRDNFEHESPIRAFTTWMVQGQYAIGKGFRPSLQHTATYLDAMERREGWRIVQILEADEQVPSFLFRQVRHVPDDVLISRMTADPDFQQRLRDLLKDAPPLSPMMPEIAEKHGVVLGRYIGPTCADPDCRFSASRHMHIDPPYENLDQLAGFAEAGRKIDEARVASEFIDATCKHEGKRSYPTTGDGKEVTFCHDCGRNIEIDGRTLGTREVPFDATHDEIREMMNKGAFDNPPSKGCTVCGEPVPTPHCPIQVCPTKGSIDPEKEKLADKIAERDGFTPARNLAGQVQEWGFVNHTKDDPINPKHYNGRECADIGERLSANGYQILKYCWRLGKKDDPCQELGKAVWYGESELKYLLAVESSGYTSDFHMKPFTHDLGDEARAFLEDRIAECSQFTQNVARMLWHGYNRRKLQCILETINEERHHRECGTGAA